MGGGGIRLLKRSRPKTDERRPVTAGGEGPTSTEAAPVRERRVDTAGGEPASRPGPGEPVARNETAGRGGPAPGERRPVRRSRRGLGWRTRDAGAAAVGAVGSGVIMIARLVMAVATLIALLIALAIVLRDVGANGQNTIVKGIHEGANFFAGSFTGLISFSGHPKRAI